MATENRLIRELFARHGARADLRLFRNASAKVWVGAFKFRADAPRTIVLAPGDVVIAGGRQMTAGLAEGSADVIGVQSVPVSSLPADAIVGRFVSLELKTESTRTAQHQRRWMEMVRKLGGLAGIVKSMEDADALLGPKP